MREEFYAVLVTQKEVLANSGSVLTRENEKAWVVVSDGWNTSRNCEGAELAKEVKRFPTEEEAVSFAKVWGGHPWYCKPKAWEVVKVILISEEVLVPIRVGALK